MRMKFEIPIDSKLALAQYTLKSRLAFKKYLENAIITLLIGGGVIFLFLITFDRRTGAIGYIFLTLGFFYFFNALHYFSYYLKRRKKIKQFVDDHIGVREKSGNMTTWSFEEDVFRYKDILLDYSIKWESFKGYKVIRSNQEIGEKQFELLIAFVDGKIKK